VLADGFLKAGYMEDVVYSAALWEIQLISYDPYIPAYPIGPEEMWL
jgi:hypothetical protein